MKKQNELIQRFQHQLAQMHQRISELETIDAQREQTEEELRQSEAKYSAAVEQLTDAVLITQDGKFKFLNKAVEGIYGYSIKEMMTMPLLETVAPECIKLVNRRIEAKRKGEEIPLSYEARIRCKDGTLKDVEVCSRFIQYQGHTATMAIVRDITERKQAEEKIFQRGRELAALHKVLMSIIQTHDLDSTLKEIVRQVGAAVGSAYTCIAVMNQDGTITIDSAYLIDVIPPVHSSQVSELAGEIIESGKHLLIADVEVAEGRKPIIENARIRSWAGIPIKTKNATIGVLFVHSLQPDAFVSSAELLAAFANQAAIAIENARLYDTVKAERERVELLLGRILTAQEDERRRLSLDLHDTVTQAMYGVLARIGAAEELLLRTNPDKARIELAHAKEAMEQTLLDVRRVAVNLHPPALELGLTQALRQLTGDFSRNNDGIICSFELEGMPRRLSPRVEIGAYRVVQEALSNARRHAMASKIVIHLEFLADCVCLTIRDDGKGFDFSGGATSKAMEGHMGLAGMMERAELVGSTLEVQTSPGKGTSVRMSIPMMESHISAVNND
jgi:PAS domain S-box-containing protein